MVDRYTAIGDDEKASVRRPPGCLFLKGARLHPNCLHTDEDRLFDEGYESRRTTEHVDKIDWTAKRAKIGDARHAKDFTIVGIHRRDGIACRKEGLHDPVAVAPGLGRRADESDGLRTPEDGFNLIIGIDPGCDHSHEGMTPIWRSAFSAAACSASFLFFPRPTP